MAGYYAHITDVQRPSPHNLQVVWEMRNGDLVTFATVESGNMLGVQIPTDPALTAQQRRQAVISQIQSAFQSFIDQANGADNILTAAQALIGVNYRVNP